MGASITTQNPFQIVRKTALDRLLESLTDESKGLAGEAELAELIEASLEQLETDDTIDAETTDQLVDALVEAQELLAEGEAPWESLEDAITIYHHAKTHKDFFLIWQQKAESLGAEALRTQTYVHFLEACRMVERGDGEVLTGWLDGKIKEFQATRRSYLELSVAEHEVTMESELCHLMLVSGMESWLEALTVLKKAIREQRDLAHCRRLAEIGQRALVTVQLFEREARSLEQKYFVNYN